MTPVAGGEPPAWPADALDRLTPRERQVFDGLIHGRSSKEIAQSLEISPRTVEVFRARVMDKMQAPHLPSLVRAAVLLGLSLLRRENADAPPALPAPSATPAEGEGPLLGPVTPFDQTVTVQSPDAPFKPQAGTAFSIAQALGISVVELLNENPDLDPLAMAVGDALATDIAGAASFGLPNLLVARGIHGAELGYTEGAEPLSDLAGWLSRQSVRPDALIERLVW